MILQYVIKNLNCDIKQTNFETSYERIEETYIFNINSTIFWNRSLPLISTLLNSASIARNYTQETPVSKASLFNDLANVVM